MDVELRPPLSGCLIVFVTVLTWGAYPLLRRMGERHFIRSMDDQGVLTRGGRRIAWSEFSRVAHVVSRFQGNASRLSDEYILRSARGRVSLPVWRTVNAKEALDYLLRRLPPGIPGLKQDT